MKRTRLRHQVPHWVKEDALHSTFFITICTQPRGLNQLAKADIWEPLAESILHRHDHDIWFCSIALAMPDHLHGLFRFPHQTRMSKAIKDWKRWTARTMNIKWQEGFFDHRIRDEASGIEKRSYILDNPVRAGLCKSPADWPFVFDFLKSQPNKSPAG